MLTGWRQYVSILMAQRSTHITQLVFELAVYGLRSIFCLEELARWKETVECCLAGSHAIGDCAAIREQCQEIEELSGQRESHANRKVVICLPADLLRHPHSSIQIFRRNA